MGQVKQSRATLLHKGALIIKWGKSYCKVRWLHVYKKWYKNYYKWGRWFIQKQPSRRVFRKMCSENMQQIYRRTPIPKCDFNKVTLQLYWNRTSAWAFFCKFAAYFQNTFSKKHLCWLLLFITNWGNRYYKLG